MNNDLYEQLIEFARKKNPARCWFDYPPTYILSKKIESDFIKNSIINLFETDEEIGLYVNVPFCESRCPYCMYYSEVCNNQRDFDIYLEALNYEIKKFNYNFKIKKLNHLYIGGGTPLMLNLLQLEKLFTIIYNNFVFKKNFQFVIEGRPENYTREKVVLLKKSGVNRVTIGIQSFNKSTLKKMNRNYSFLDVKRAVDKIRQVGIRNINIDIIIGLPGENMDFYKRTLKNVFKLFPDSISCTQMLYGKRVILNESKKIIDDKIEKDYIFLENEFKKNNFFPIKNKKGIYLKNKQKYANNLLLFDNLNSKSHIFGLGAGGVTSSLTVSYINDFIPGYIKTYKERSDFHYFGMILSVDDLMRQYFILKLYLTQEVKGDEFFKKFNKDMFKIFEKEIKNLHKNNFITVSIRNKKIFLKNKNYKVKDFFYNILKFVYKKEYLNEIAKKMKNENYFVSKKISND